MRILLLLNLLALAFGLGWRYLVADRSSALNQFNAEKIRLWSQPEAYAPGTGRAPAKPVPSVALCLTIGGLNQARYEELRGRLADAGLSGDACVFNFDKKLAWWVYWPSEYEASRRDKVLKAIRAAGVKDVMPITQGAMAQSFSLGVFASEVQANQYRDALRGKGLDKVQFGPRPNVNSAYLGCRSGDAGKLDALKAKLPDWLKPAAEQNCWP